MLPQPRCQTTVLRKSWQPIVGTLCQRRCLGPPRFSSAVMGTVAHAKSSAAFVKSNRVSLLPKQTSRISFERPSGPGELPEGALRKRSANHLASNCNSGSGTKSRTSAGISWSLSCGRLRLNSSNVDSSRGANVTPVNSWRALDTLPPLHTTLGCPLPTLLLLVSVHGGGLECGRGKVLHAFYQICPQTSGKII